MSDVYSNITDESGKKYRPCRVAYTINNTQPVISTIIGSQPLFYMDFETDGEEENTDFDAAGYSILESELETLNRELARFENFSKTLAPDTEEKIRGFLEEAKEITALTPHKKTDMHPGIENLERTLKQSRLAASYLKAAEEHGVKLCFSAQVETAFYDRKSGHIIINPTVNESDRILLAVRELRRHWQHRQGALIHPLTFHPDNAILVHRAQIADLMVSVIRVAWELQLSGVKEPWEAIENSSMADMGRAFAREAFLDFRTINNGQAMAAVFESWFLSERCRAQDKLLINQMLADHQGYVFEFRQSETAMTPTLIGALGAMPFGKNYLAEHAATIMEDPIFTDVRDRSNANFLWFIKFERTFRETEQELQNLENSKTGDALSSGFQSEQREQTNGPSQQCQSAEIISLPSAPDAKKQAEKKGDNTANRTGRLSPRNRKARRGHKGGVSNVIYLRCWSGE